MRRASTGTRYLGGRQVDRRRSMIVGDNTAIKATGGALRQDAARDAEDLAEVQGRRPGVGNYLSKRFVDSKFAFTKTLSGAKELRPRWRRGIDAGRRPPRRAARPDLCRALFPAAVEGDDGRAGRQPEEWRRRSASRATAGWATRPRRRRSTKLAKMDVMVGYPDKFRDYSKLTMKADDLYGNVKRSAAFEWDYQLSDLGKPVDRKKWAMSPATVERLQRRAREQDRVPGRHPAAAVLRSAGRRGGQLRRRSARSSATRSCTASTTRAARSTRTARSATGGPRPTPTRFKALTDDARQAIFVLRGGAGRVHQRRPDDGREYRRHVGARGRLRGLQDVAGAASRRRSSTA